MSKGVAVVGLVALPFVLALCGYQWQVTGDPLGDPRLISRPFDKPGFGLGVGGGDNAFTIEEIEGNPVVIWYTDPSLPPRGHTVTRGLFNTIRNLESLNDHLFGWVPFLTLSFCWLVFIINRPKFGDWLLLGLLFAVVGVYVSYWAAGIMYGPRYYYAVLPSMLLLTARGVIVMGNWIGKKRGQWLVIGLLTFLIAGNLFVYLPDAIEDGRGFNFVSGAPLAAVKSQVEGPSIIFITAQEGVWWQYGQFFSDNTPDLDGKILYARNLGEENQRLLALYPERAAYCFDETSNSVVGYPCEGMVVR